jgi:tetratricopeptide (TPR) repeat protein
MYAVILLVAVASVLDAPARPAEAPATNEAVRFEHVQYGDRLERDGGSTRTMDMRVRVLTPQGVAEFGQIGMLFIEGLGDVQFQDVVIEKPDGRRIDAKKGLIEDVNPLGVSATSLPADIRFRKLTLAGLEPGDLLSYRIVHRQQPIAPGRVFGVFKLPPLPGRPLQTYELDVPRGGDITVRLREGLGAGWQDAPSPEGRSVRRLTLKVDLPPEKEPEEKKERARWTEPDITFTSFRSWDDVSSWWWGIARDRMKPDAATARQAADLTAGAVAAREKVAALFAFVAGRVRYLNVSFRLGRMQPRPAADVLKNRYGDCKDKHGLLAALASALGVDVRPVLINSAGGDLHDDAPGPQEFDHVVSVARLGPAPSDWLWMDSTNPFGPPGYLGSALRDKRALLVEADGGATLVRTPKEPPFVPRHEVSVKGALDAQGVLRAHVVWLFHSDIEIALRAAMSSLPLERRGTVMGQAFLKDWGETTVREVSFSDPLDTRAPFRVEFDVEAKGSTRNGKRALGLPLPELDLPKAPDRVVAGEPPVSFIIRELAVKAEIEMPEGQTSRAPLSISLERPFGSFRSSYSVEGRTLRMERTLDLRQASLGEGDLPAYEAFRGAVSTDSNQEFPIEGAGALTGAAGLNSEGLAAFQRKDYAKAAELLRKAADADPKTKDVFEGLGRALHELGKDEEAVAAFTRQIEVTPFHESAYAWRAYALLELDRGDEAERDLLKQIEVAPFKAWSYERLAVRRRKQGRFAEALDLYMRAATLEPTKAERWFDVGTAQVVASQPEEARRSLERAVSLDAPDWMKVRAAVMLRFLGDVARAGELAGQALPSLGKRLAQLTPDAFDEDDDYWMERLTEAWRLVGEAAAAAGDSARAQSYLEAAWTLAFLPEAAWALGVLREKDGRTAAAVDLWSMALAVPGGARHLPEGYRTRLDAARAKLAASPTRGGELLTTLRTVQLPGAATADITEQVLLLVNADGAVESVKNLSGKDPKAFDRQLPKLGPIRLPWPRPDAEPVKVIRRALLVCATVSNCSLVFDLPQGHWTPPSGNGSIRIVSLEPKDGTALQPGQQVAVSIKVHYEQEGTGRVALVLQDETGPLPGASLEEAEVKGTGDVTLKGSFTVPALATRIDLFVPLTPAGAQATSAVVGATYPVRR